MMMIATSAYKESTRRHLLHDIKAKNGMIKVSGLRSIANAQMDMSDNGTGRHMLPRATTLPGLLDQATNINRATTHIHQAIFPDPTRARTIPIDLQPVLIW